MVRKNCLAVIGLVIIVLGCGTKKAREFEWGNLRNLGPNINSPGKDEHATFTEDGKTMYFASDREGGMGNYDLYVSTFENGEWTKARLLPSPINTERDEFDVFVTLDGKKMFFASNRHNEDPYWNCDVFVSEWDGEKWGEPKIYDENFVTPEQADWGACVVTAATGNSAAALRPCYGRFVAPRHYRRRADFLVPARSSSSP